MNKVSILIVTYNGMKWLEKCLGAIYGSTIEVDVVIVDNKSSDITVSFIKENYSKVHLIESKQNLGFGGGNNLGIKFILDELSSKYVFLLNQDAYVEKNAVENLLNIAELNKNYGILSPIHLNGNATLYDAGFVKYVNKGKNPMFFEEFIENNPNKIYEVAFVNAAAWFLPISTFKTVGGFDPIFYHYGEDDNYCQRVNYHKLKIGVISNAKICHDRTINEPEFKYYTPLYFKLYERSLKTRWANLLDTSLDHYVKLEKKKFVKDLLKSIVRFRINDLKGLSKKYRIYSKSLDEIKSSRKINKKIGTHYI